MNPEDWIRREVDLVPIPHGLENRVRLSYSRRRRWFRAGIFSAAACLLVGLILALWTRESKPTEIPIAFGVSLKKPFPAPLSLAQTHVVTTVEETDGALVFHLSPHRR